MHTTCLSIQMHADDTALLRLLGVVRRRGYAVRALEAADRQGDAWRIVMCIESTRPIDALIRQIGRLIGVSSITAAPSSDGVAASVA